MTYGAEVWGVSKKKHGPQRWSSGEYAVDELGYIVTQIHTSKV